jgi:signal transduction histidine kinase
VRVDVDAPALRVRADREGLRVVLRNLLENAFKFTRGTPDPRIEIGARRNDGSALLWVKDNGIGFEQVYHDQIFEIFQRLHRYGEIEGTGIGLALARKAMQRMRGRIWAKSAPGEGATFYVELPLFDEGAANE